MKNAKSRKLSLDCPILKKKNRCSRGILPPQKFLFVKRKRGKQKLILLLSGAVIGALNGFFGGGGGMVCVPILENVLHLDEKRSHATAIAVIMPLSIISAFIYVYNGYISSLPLLIVGAGVVLGGVVGSYILKVLPPKALRVVFALIMLAGGIRLIIG